MKIFLYLLSVLLLFVTMGFAQDSYWPLDIYTDDIVGDFTGEPSATGVSFVEDPVRGPVMQLDGETGYVTLPYGLLDYVQDVTITCWFNWAGGSVWQRVYSFGNPEPDVRTVYLCPCDGWTPNKLHLTIGGQPTDGEFTWKDWTPDTISVNTWYFTAFVLKEDTCKFYVNDQLWVNEGGVLVNPENLMPDDGNYLGKSHWTADPTFNGMIDDVRFYAYALNEAEILALYLAPSSVNIPDHRVREFALEQNYPNPFNSQTTIKYRLDKSTDVSLKIYNISGQEIETLVNSGQAAGDYAVTWNINGFSSGIYFCKLEVGGMSETKKLIYQK